MAKFTYNHLHLTAGNPENLISFFTGALGAKIVNEQLLAGGRKSWNIDIGGVIIRISGSTGVDDTLSAEYAAARGRNRYGLHHLALSVDNIDQAYAEAKAKGAAFLIPPRETTPGAKFAFMNAPENILIELIESKQL